MDRPDRDRLGGDHHILFIVPPYRVSIPGQEGWKVDYVNYAPVLVGGVILLLGGWYVLSARKWFKGPVRMGTEEELERLEAEQEKQFAVPADATIAHNDD